MNVVNLIALVLGVLATVRKLDVRRREPEEFPHVDRAMFERWRARESLAYTILSFGCFFEIVLDFSFRYFALKTGLPWSLVRLGGFCIFIAWLVTLGMTVIFGVSARKLRDDLGITLSRRANP